MLIFFYLLFSPLEALSLLSDEDIRGFSDFSSYLLLLTHFKIFFHRYITTFLQIISKWNFKVRTILPFLLSFSFFSKVSLSFTFHLIPSLSLSETNSSPKTKQYWEGQVCFGTHFTRDCLSEKTYSCQCSLSLSFVYVFAFSLLLTKQDTTIPGHPRLENESTHRREGIFTLSLRGHHHTYICTHNTYTQDIHTRHTQDTQTE